MAHAISWQFQPYITTHRSHLNEVTTFWSSRKILRKPNYATDVRLSGADWIDLNWVSLENTGYFFSSTDKGFDISNSRSLPCVVISMWVWPWQFKTTSFTFKCLRLIIHLLKQWLPSIPWIKPLSPKVSFVDIVEISQKNDGRFSSYFLKHFFYLFRK